MRVSRRALVLALIVLIAGAGTAIWFAREMRPRPPGDITADRLLSADSDSGQWMTAGRDWRQSYYSPLAQIDPENVKQLGFAWASEPIDPMRGFQGTPIVVDGRMYTSGPNGSVYALDARTGRSLWSFQPDISPDVISCCGGSNRGVAVWEGKVYVAALDAQLYALDAADGHIVWKTDTVIDHGRSYSSTGAPYVAGRHIVIGQSGAEYDTRGYISAYDLETGKLGWRFFVVPGDPKKGFEHPELEMAAKTWDPDSRWDIGGGGAPWDGMAYDPELNLIYVGTGNGLPWSRDLRSPKGGDNLFLSSILAINADTGRLKWHYQTTPADNWDYNAAQKMILADLKIKGRQRKVLMQAPKNSFFYVIDRMTGELISAEPYIFRNWASHVDKRTGRPVETAQADYSKSPKMIFPTDTGGHNWQPMSYNPGTGLVYIPTLLAGEIFGNLEQPFERKAKVWNNGIIYAPVEWFKEGLHQFPKSWPPLAEIVKGLPESAPRTFLTAWDPVRQKEVWKVETTSKDGPESRTSPGIMSTGTGLVFQGSLDGVLNIFRATDGALLHSVHVGEGIQAAPMTYTIDGEQYVAFMAGTTSDEAGRIIALKLGGGKVPAMATSNMTLPRTGPPIWPDPSDKVLIEKGAALFASTCAACHLSGRAPDLTHMTVSDHMDFMDIVRKGKRADKGMPNFGQVISKEDAKALQTYLVHKAWVDYRTRAGKAGAGK